jgi:D-arabinono-1,4-lactone oxidase
MAPPISPAADGFYHPASEADVIALVQYARANKLQVRARGATHSIAWSIYADAAGGPNQPDKTLEESPPTGPNINIAFDKMADLAWIDETNGIVEVGPGCHLGQDPLDPFGQSTLENSMLYQIAQKGWAVNITGGITHQTVAGFVGTGSAGGSVKYAFDNVIAFRVVDGLGSAEWIEQDNSIFPAFLTAMGLLGIVTRMRFKLAPMYNIQGTETAYPPTPDEGGPNDLPCPIDLFGPGDDDRPSLQKFLTDTDYSRMTWYPQKGHSVAQIWRASRVPASNTNLIPYQQFPPTFFAQTQMLLAALLLVLVGNSDSTRINALLKTKVARYNANIARIFSDQPGWAWTKLKSQVVGWLVLAVGGVIGSIKGAMRLLYPKALPFFTPVTTKKEAGDPFHDWYWRSLPMDNTADDVLLSTEFVEIWVPIQYTQQAMTLFKGMFDNGGYQATGYFAQEIYAAAPSPGWLNPSYSDGTDEYKDGVVRFDAYWYRDNEGSPDQAHGFFEQYWDLLLKNNVPFRFHWGKFVPYYNFAWWANYYATVLPKFQDFLDLRTQRDPDNVFFTTYWQQTLLGKTLAS